MTVERVLWYALVMCVTYRRLTAQPTVDTCSTDDDNNHQVQRMERMMSTIQTISERQMSLMEQMVSKQQALNQQEQTTSGRQTSLMEQIHCTLLSIDERGKGSNPEDVRCRQRHDDKQTCYRIVREAMNWEAARAYCRSNRDGMDLVSIESAEEHAFLASYITYLHGSCVEFHTSGRKDANGVWKWMATGQPFHFTSWASGQPDNTGHYCYIWNTPPGWNTWDDYKDANRCFLCEYDIVLPTYCHK